MKAIILAAGDGRRMRPLTDRSHKALLPIAGSTLLGRIVDGLSDIRVSEILVVTGHRADEVTSFLRSTYPAIAFTIVHNERYATTNNVVSLSLALDHLEPDEDILLVECDVVFDATLLRRLLGKRGNIALVDRYRAGMAGTVVAVEDEVITRMYPPHLQGRDFSYADKFKTLNIYRFDATFCRSTLQPLVSCYANVIDGNCDYESVLGMLVNMPGNQMGAELVAGTAWAGVDDPNDLAAARFVFEPDQRSEVLDRCYGGHWNLPFLDFGFMRNAYFPTDAMFAAMRHALPQLVRSYSSSQKVINEKLGFVLECAAGRVQALHGSSQLYPMFADLLPAGRVMVPSPTFGEYARVLPRAEAYRDAPGVDLRALEVLPPDVTTILFVNPNNPTGTVISTEWLHDFAARHPKVRVVIDESFVDFSGEESMVRRLERDPLSNVLVLTSLSKTLGAPGLRLGYAYTQDRQLLDVIGGRLPFWNLSAPGEHLLELCLKFRADYAASIAQTMADRERFRAALARLEIVETVYPSGGNFVLVRLIGTNHRLAATVRHRLLAEHSIDVKDASPRFALAAPFLRVAVRRPEENARFASAVAEVAKSVADLVTL